MGVVYENAETQELITIAKIREIKYNITNDVNVILVMKLHFDEWTKDN